MYVLVFMYVYIKMTMIRHLPLNHVPFIIEEGELNSFSSLYMYKDIIIRFSLLFMIFLLRVLI